MFDFSRRRFVVGAATAASVFGFGKPMEFLPSALAQGAGDRQNPKGLTHLKFKGGDVEVTQIFDGESLVPHQPGFIGNASIDDRKAALKSAGLPDDAIPISYTISIVKAGDKYIMFDSGNNASGAPKTGRTQQNMKAAGIDPSQISTIVVTHFHGDHIFGLFGKGNEQAFPNAEIIMPAAEYDFWTNSGRTASLPEARQGLAKRVQATFPTWKNIRRFSGEGDVLPGIKPVPSYGHTPGHTSYMLSSANQQYIVLADVTNIHQLFVRNPGWHLVFDQDKYMAEATRRKMFDRVVAEKLTVGGYHWGMPGCGKLAKDGNSYVFTPMA